MKHVIAAICIAANFSSEPAWVVAIGRYSGLAGAMTTAEDFLKITKNGLCNASLIVRLVSKLYYNEREDK